LTSDLSLKTTEVILALVLRILLTSSHVIDPKTDAWYLFKKTADSQCRIMTRRSSLEHRRLRFSFHINNVKDPEPPQRPDLFSASSSAEAAI
jgi:hypothetical protein